MPPDWRQGERFGRSVPEQIAESLARSRRWGKGFPLAYEHALLNVRWPHEPTQRHQWRQLSRQEAFIALWERAYDRQALPVDVVMLHHAIEGDEHQAL